MRSLRFLAVFLVLPLLAPAEKTQSTFYPRVLTERAQANARRYPWAERSVRAIIARAQPWLRLPDEELWGLMFGPAIDRSHSVWSSGYCPACRRPVLMYDWEIDAWRHPWKVRCPHCREFFPKNDFAAFHRSGLNEQGVFDPRRADRRLLFNVEHPDPGDTRRMFGVDGGEGYAEGDARWWFAGTYLRYGQWDQLVLAGVTHLAAAYVVTGEARYARQAGILLDRIADVFPTFDYGAQGLVYERRRYGGGVAGYVSYAIDSAYDVRKLALAYDQIFEAIRQDGSLVAFLSRQAAAHKLENPKRSFADIQRNIEERILRDVQRNPLKIRTNYPGQEGTLAIIDSVLDWPSSRPRVHAALDEIVARTTEVDGVSGEKGLNSYATIGPHFLAHLLEHYLRADPVLLTGLLERHPQLGQTYRFFVDTWVGRQYYPLSGDAGSFAVRSPVYAGLPLTPDRGEGRHGVEPPVSMFTFLWRLARATGDPLYFQIIHLGLEQHGEDAIQDLFAEDPAAVVRETRQAVARHGAWPKLGSVLKAEWRLALLRTPHAPEAAVWLDFDSVPQSRLKSHYHYDAMNLGLFAKGLDLLPEFGYPAVQFGDWHTPQARWHRKTAAHNTVVVDGKDQAGGDARATLWADGHRVRMVRASSPDQYRGKQYERTVAMAETGGGDFYVLDVFRVAGGREHAKITRSHFARLETPGLRLQQAPPWGGTNLLRGFRSDPRPPENWSADFLIEDRLGYLPPGAQVRLRYTDLTREAEAMTCESWTVRNATSTEQFWIPTVITRRAAAEGGELASTFAGVLEPYETRPRLRTIRRLPLVTEDSVVWGDEHVAVELEGDGFRDLWMAADAENPLGRSPSLRAGGALVQPDRRVRLSGELAWVRTGKEGAVEALALAGGDALSAGGFSLRLHRKVVFLELEIGPGQARVRSGPAEAVADVRDGGRRLRVR